VVVESRGHEFAIREWLDCRFATLDGNPGTRVTGHPSPVTLVPGHFFYFFYIFFGGITFFLKKMTKNFIFSLFFLSFPFSFSLSLYTQIGFFLV
jgi:hypothetical protein